MGYNAELPIGSRCIKYLMFIFNIMFMMIGVALLAIGVCMWTLFNKEMLKMYMPTPIILTVVGAIIFFITFFGCCGAVTQNYCMVSMFTFLMILIFILELGVGIAGYVKREDIGEAIANKALDTIKYNMSDFEWMSWKTLQSKHNCCGVHGPSDWVKLRNESTLPYECCGPMEVGVVCTSTTTGLHEKGCAAAMEDLIKPQLAILGWVVLGVAFFQVFAIGFSIYLAIALKEDYANIVQLD